MKVLGKIYKSPLDASYNAFCFDLIGNLRRITRTRKIEQKFVTCSSSHTLLPKQKTQHRDLVADWQINHTSFEPRRKPVRTYQHNTEV